MKLKFFVVLSVLLIQGCISLPKGDVHAFHPTESAEGLQFFSTNLPVTIHYDSNYDVTSPKKLRTYRQQLLADTTEFFAERGINVVDVSHLKKKPSEYLDITLIVDRPVSKRREDSSSAMFWSGVGGVLSLGLLPAVGSDTDVYVILKRAQGGKVVHETRLSKASRLYKGALLLPASPFYTHQKSVSKTYQAILASTFNLEVVK